MLDDLTYNYDSSKKNKLEKIGDVATKVAGYSAELDFPTQTTSSNYVYNSIGELIENTDEDRGFEYNAAGLVTRVYKLSNSNTIVTYTYNDKGLRHNKTSYSSGTAVKDTYYSYDAGGMQVASYTKDLTAPAPVTILKDHTLYGGGRTGLLDAATGDALFELSDHLGNVRAVIKDDGNGDAETVSYTDYYPHGGTLPGRTYQSSLNFPYAYQGQEKDAETGLTNFELRQYDPRIGRWYNPDPMGQHHSPYLAMGNNPIISIDPDGVWDGDSGYDDAMTGIIDRNKNDFAMQSLGASGQTFNWMGASAADREMLQKHYGRDYNSSYANQFYDIASTEGGYTAQDGSIYNLDGTGNLSRTVTESMLIAGTASWSSGASDITTTSFIGKINPPASGIYYVFEKYTPNIYRNISGFLKERPDWQYLHYAGGGKEGLAIQNANRKVINQILPASPNFLLSRDEFPMASTLEGGDIATLKVKYVPSIENSVQGGQLSWVYRGLSRGSIIKVVPVPKGAEESPVFKPSPVDITPLVVPLLIRGIIKIMTSPKPILTTPGFFPFIPILNDDKLDLNSKREG